MRLNLLDERVFKSFQIAGDTKAAVLRMAPGTTRDLRQLRGAQQPMTAAIKLSFLGKSHMVDIHVQPHANGIGGDQKIDLARLIHLDLGVSGARAQAAHHNGRAAALLANSLGNGINIIGRKSRHGAASGQAR